MLALSFVATPRTAVCQIAHEYLTPQWNAVTNWLNVPMILRCEKVGYEKLDFLCIFKVIPNQVGIGNGYIFHQTQP